MSNSRRFLCIHSPRWLRKRCVPLIAVLAPALALAFAVGAPAQDAAKVKDGLAVWKSAGCSECHGAFADGEKENDDAPTGANLRQTRLDNATIAETIRCGRPGAGMPSFDESAYTEHGCYGEAVGPKPDDLYPAPRNLGAAEIEFRGGVSARPCHRAGRRNGARLRRILRRKRGIILRCAEISMRLVRVSTMRIRLMTLASYC